MRRHLLRGLATVAGYLLTAVPRRHRFDVARRLGLTLAPLLPSTLYEKRASLLDGPREEAVRLALQAMRRLHIPFDPAIAVDGAELPSGAAIVAGAHFGLNTLVLRLLFDRGNPPAAIAASPDRSVCYAGTLVPIDYLESDRNPLLAARARLAAGQKVLVLLDDENPEAGYVQVDTAAGARYVSDVIPKFAERLNVPLFFMHTSIGDRGDITIEFRTAPRAADEALDAFCRALTADAARIRRPPGAHTVE